MASDELAAKLSKRNIVIEADEQGMEPELPSLKVFNPYTEFKEFSRKEIQFYERMFKKYDVGQDKFIDQHELQLMMEKLGFPQTHLGLKAMIKEVDEDQDDKINFREFLLIFRKAAAGELSADSGLLDIYRQINEVDVDEEGVKGAKNFFQAKVDMYSEELQACVKIPDEKYWVCDISLEFCTTDIYMASVEMINEQSVSNKFEQEIREEQEQRRKEEEERKQSRQAFKDKKNLFQ